MKRKLLIAVMVIASALCGAFGLTACKDKTDGGNNGGNGGQGTTNHKHELSFIGEHAPNCNEDGNTAYYICTVCNKWFSDGYGRNEITDKGSVVLGKRHNATRRDRVEATCFEDGNIEYYVCGICDKWFADSGCTTEIADKESVVLAKGHKISFVEAKDSTCAVAGNIAYYACSGCDEWYTDEEGNNPIADRDSVFIEKKPHDMRAVAEKAATCYEDGNIAYYECNNCRNFFKDAEGKNEILNKNSVRTPKSHDFVDKICTKCGTHEPTAGLKYTEYADSCTVSGIGEATDSEIYIAEFYNGKPVTSIGERAFANCKFTSITIPDGIDYIGGYAFYNCSKLTSITIPGSVTLISGYAFHKCTALESATILEGVMMINDCAFFECESLESVEIPDSVIIIGVRAFDSCGRLTQVTVPDSVIELGDYAFANCVNLTSAVLGENIGAIGEGTFSGCVKLTTVTVPGGISYIGRYAFDGCEKLTTIIYKGNGAQWRGIEKEYAWNRKTGEYTVQCNDININKSADE